MATVLDVLFAVEKEAQQRAEKMFGSTTRNGFGNVSLEFLRAKSSEGFRKGIAKSASEHNQELRAISKGPHRVDDAIGPRRNGRTTRPRRAR